MDLDSTVCGVCGRAKHGAAYGHTKVLGYHPLVAVRSDTGEVLHVNGYIVVRFAANGSVEGYVADGDCRERREPVMCVL